MSTGVPYQCSSIISHNPIITLVFASPPQKALSSKTDFFARVSHEFRTPLNVVLGFSEELTKSDDVNLSAEIADRVQYILVAGMAHSS